MGLIQPSTVIKCCKGCQQGRLQVKSCLPVIQQKKWVQTGVHSWSGDEVIIWLAPGRGSCLLSTSLQLCSDPQDHSQQFIYRWILSGVLCLTVQVTNVHTIMHAVSVCFHKPPNSDMDYRLINMLAWSVNACVSTWGKGTPTVSQHISSDSGKKAKIFLMPTWDDDIDGLAVSRRGRRTSKFSWVSWQSLHSLRHGDQCREDQADDKQHQ